MTRPFSPTLFALGLLSLAAESLRALPAEWHRLSLLRVWEQTRDQRENNCARGCGRAAEICDLCLVCEDAEYRAAQAGGPRQWTAEALASTLPASDLPDGRVPDSRREVWDGETVRMVGEMGVTVGGE